MSKWSALLLTNIDSSEILIPLRTGKSKYPKCFSERCSKKKKASRKPCDYMNNAKACMTLYIFIGRIRSLNDRMRIQEQNDINAYWLLSCISKKKKNHWPHRYKYSFLTSNWTSQLQSLYLGVIRPVKWHYGKFIVRKLLFDIAEKKYFLQFVRKIPQNHFFLNLLI